ncbi:MAG: hypothetical protein HN584_04520, partial [Akkermansiaceae bacterium]|nr:hypothetical protein [Akkermansiaceae bacterium]
GHQVVYCDGLAGRMLDPSSFAYQITFSAPPKTVPGMEAPSTSKGEKFDENGNYVIKYCPELGKLPKKYIHKPWDAPADVLRGAEIILGKNYPYPIVDLRRSRFEALEKYNLVKAS